MMRAGFLAALIAGWVLAASADGSAREAGPGFAGRVYAQDNAAATRERLRVLTPRLQLAAVYQSAPDLTGISAEEFDFARGASEEPRISIDHVETFLPTSCDEAAGANDAGCRATGSVFCGEPGVDEAFVSSALMVRVRSEGTARCYLISTHHSLDRPGEAGALGLMSDGGRAACRFVRAHDLSASAAGRARSWTALNARPRGARARLRWDFRGLSLPAENARHNPLPPRIPGESYAFSVEDDYARLQMSEGAACLAEDAVEYASPVEDPTTCDAIEWVGSFLGVRRAATFEGGAAAARLFRFGARDFAGVRDTRRRFVEHRLPSWEGVSGFAALCRRGGDITPLCIHSKGDAITRFQRQELGRSRRIVVGDDSATGNGCVALRWVFPDGAN